MGEYEEQLKELAYGEAWSMTGFRSLNRAVEKQQQQVAKAREGLPSHWKGESSKILPERLNTHERNFVRG